MTARGKGKEGACIYSPGPESPKLKGEDFCIYVRKWFLFKARKSSSIGRIFWGNLGRLKVMVKGSWVVSGRKVKAALAAVSSLQWR